MFRAVRFEVNLMDNFALLRKTIVIWTSERESAREDNRKATNNDIGTRDFVFVEILGLAR